jgi:hypothetical protein
MGMLIPCVYEPLKKKKTRNLWSAYGRLAITAASKLFYCHKNTMYSCVLAMNRRKHALDVLYCFCFINAHPSSIPTVFFDTEE